MRRACKSGENGKPEVFAQLLATARAGDSEALAQLLARYRSYLLQIANQKLPENLRARVAPSDMVQDTMIRLQAGLSHFRGQSEQSLLVWLRRILENTITNARYYHGALRREVGRDCWCGERDDVGIPQPDTTPSERAILREDARSLREAVRMLPVHYQQVIDLRHREQKTFEEIGDQIDRSPNAARMIWYRAVMRLQAELCPSETG